MTTEPQCRNLLRFGEATTLDPGLRRDDDF